jgi:hypothetical protein
MARGGYLKKKKKNKIIVVWMFVVVAFLTPVRRVFQFIRRVCQPVVLQWHPVFVPLHWAAAAEQL